MAKLDRKNWLSALGFHKDPFNPEAVRAEADDLLFEGAFIEFDYYSNVKGGLEAPGPRFIFGRRGGGKTALRKQLFNTFSETLRAEGDRILPIEYIEFNPVLERANHDFSVIRPRYHAEEIVSLIIQKLFDLMIKEEGNLSFVNLPGEDKRLFVWYARNFGVLHDWQRSYFLGKAEGIEQLVTPEKVLKLGKGFLQTIADVTSPVAGRLVELLNDMLNIERPIEGLDPSQVPLIDLLEGVVKICKSLGLSAVYILVDDIDEPQFCGSREDFKPAYELIRPLAAYPKILGIPGLIFKFFLPFEIRDWCLGSLRLDKFSEHVIAWPYINLRRILSSRLSLASEGGATTLDPLCEQDLKTAPVLIDELVVDFAKEKGNPRAILYCCNEMLVEHFRENRAVDDKITRATWERARLRAEEVLS